MFFGKKNKEKVNCDVCSSKISEKYSFCPYCGSDLIDKEKEAKDFGMLGRKDIPDSQFAQSQPQGFGFGITDKLLSALVQNLAKNLNKQFGELDKTEVRTFPDGISISIGQPQAKKSNEKKKMANKNISSEQLAKMSTMPRAIAKSNVRRLSNKVIYELATPGLESADDVFVSKTESGYEIKAIGNKKVYINNLPIELPLHGFSIENDRLLLEFKTEFA